MNINKIIIPSAVAFGMVTTMNISDSFANEFKSMAENQSQKIERQVQIEGTLTEQIEVIKERLADMGKSIKYDIPYNRESMKNQIYQFVDAVNSNGMLYNNVLAEVNWDDFDQAYETLRKNMFEQLSAMTGVDYTKYMKKFDEPNEEAMEQVTSYLETVPLQHQYLLSMSMIETGEMLEQQSANINDKELGQKVQQLGEVIRTVGPVMFNIGYAMENEKIYLGGQENEYNQVLDKLSQEEINNFNAIIGEPVVVADCYFEHLQDKKNAQQDAVSVAMR